MKLVKLLAITATAMTLSTTANAAVSVTQFPGTNLGAFSFSVAGNTITINETWTSSDNVFLQFTGLDAGVNYTIVKRILNQSGLTWISLANELLDPGLDDLDPRPQPGFVPVGYSTSNDGDGLSFAQGSGLPRTSTGFPSMAVDELSDARDFIDFFGGAGVASGAPLFTVTYAIRDNDAANQPFLLSQRVNTRSVTGAVPEPATWAMMLTGFGVIGGVMRRRQRTRVSFA